MPRRVRIDQGASEERLEKLLAERLRPGADKAAIDARIWDLFGETWAVMFTDLAGFSRRVREFGIIHFLQIIQESERLLIPCIERYDGILLKTDGDTLMVIFRNVRKAIECALAMNRTAREYDASREAAERLLLCIGLGWGRMLRIGDRDVFGAEVNTAAKLGEDLAKAGEIVVSGAVHQAVLELTPPLLGLTFEPIAGLPPELEGAHRLVIGR
jgi:class 3 adenylate cyclase